MKPKLTDALELIQRAQESIDSNQDDVYCELLESSVKTFKHQLSKDHGLPIEFFEPVTAGQVVEEQPEGPFISEDHELTLEAVRFYEILDSSIWLSLFLILNISAYLAEIFLFLKMLAV